MLTFDPLLDSFTVKLHFWKVIAFCVINVKFPGSLWGIYTGVIRAEPASWYKFMIFNRVRQFPGKSYSIKIKAGQIAIWNQKLVAPCIFCLPILFENGKL